jgi:4-amino-4-deoxy-L-arabinose transferase-like glycosyltransferase
MIPLGLFGVALLVRAVAGIAFLGPAYPDSYYYVHVAERLAAGAGFTTQYVWNLDDVATLARNIGSLPAPANAYWMPLAEIIQVPSVFLLGSNAFAASLPFWIIGALAAPLTYFIGRDAGLARGTGVAAGLMVAIPAGLTPFMSQPDNFGPFMTIGALALWLCARGAKGDRRAFVAGGMVVGLATLARTDGALLGLPYAVIGVRELGRVVRGTMSVLGWKAPVACATLFVIVVAPWFYRQLEVFGSVAPAASTGNTFWLTSYDELFSFSSSATPATWAAQGLGAIVSTRIAALLTAVGLIALMPLAVVLAPFAAIGAWISRASRDFQPFFLYAIALILVMGIVFAVLVSHGTFLHAAAALVPHTYLLVCIGIAHVAKWASQRRRGWDPVTATRVFTAGAVVVVALVGLVQSVDTRREWSEARMTQEAVVGPLKSSDTSGRFMAVDPGAINYLTGREGLVTPTDPLPVIEEVMRRYDVRWLILERRSIVPALEPVLRGDVRPAWLSDPVVIANDQGQPEYPGDIEPAAAQASIPAAAIYAVCLSADDARCQ